MKNVEKADGQYTEKDREVVFGENYVAVPVNEIPTGEEVEANKEEQNVPPEYVYKVPVLVGKKLVMKNTQ